MLIGSISELLAEPAVYAMYGGGTRRWVAYVGIADHLRRRIEQYLVKRDSSVATGTAAVGLHPEHVREVAWWQHQAFSDRTALRAGELVAFGELEPALRSRGGITDAAEQKAKEPDFLADMRRLFGGEPSGRLLLPSLAKLAATVSALEARVRELERRST